MASKPPRHHLIHVDIVEATIGTMIAAIGINNPLGNLTIWSNVLTYPWPRQMHQRRLGIPTVHNASKIYAIRVLAIERLS
mgnify:FL=1